MGIDNSKLKNELLNTKNPLDEFQISLHLKDVLEKRRPLNDFKEWLKILRGLLDTNDNLVVDYIRRLDFLKNNEKNSTEFFRYCLNLSNSGDELKATVKFLFDSNLLGPICFLTAEIGRWSTVGGVGVLVDELTQGLRAFGQEVIVISPYYNTNRKGESNYLGKDNIKYTKNVSIDLDTKYEFGVHYGNENNGIKYYFLHNANLFPKAYPDFNCVDAVKAISCFGKGSLQLLCDIGIIPSVIVTNDWFTGLTAAFARSGQFGDAFKNTSFVHICHNLDPFYEGRLYPNDGEGTLEGIYKFDHNWLINPHWSQRVINPSRCALLISDKWGTVSFSYKEELLRTSDLKDLLSQKPFPIAFPNGIIIEKRRREIKEKTNFDRVGTKKYLQQKYFGYQDVDLSVPLYSFIGRITVQKGVHLILDAVEELIKRTKQKINILIGGTGNSNEDYFRNCAGKINELRNKYPNCFWADPQSFFTDGHAVNLGSDFGLIPSQFEPGGLVQHEFFSAGTPVIAHKTGGLKDTVFEFRYDYNSGNGFTFESHSCDDFIKAVQRSLDLFNNKEKYEICRKNAFISAIDISDVTRAWGKDFYLMKNKIWFNANEAGQANPTGYYDSCYWYGRLGKIPISFSIDFKKENQPKSVQLSGSFDNWGYKHNLVYDNYWNRWFTSILINGGKYLYKFIVDGEWMINMNDKSQKGEDGSENNVIEL